MNLPNKLTILRVILIPFFLVALMWDGQQFPAGKWVALAIFIIASLTDMLDGYLARKNNLVTNFGKFMDPLADKLLVSAALIAFIEMERMPAWVVIIIISREFIISGFRLIASDNGVVIAASYWGKIKTAWTLATIWLLIADLGGSVVYIIEQIAIYVSVILTVVSLVDYLIKNRKVLSDTK